MKWPKVMCACGHFVPSDKTSLICNDCCHTPPSQDTEIARAREAVDGYEKAMAELVAVRIAAVAVKSEWEKSLISGLRQATEIGELKDRIEGLTSALESLADAADEVQCLDLGDVREMDSHDIARAIPRLADKPCRTSRRPSDFDGGGAVSDHIEHSCPDCGSLVCNRTCGRPIVAEKEKCDGLFRNRAGDNVRLRASLREKDALIADMERVLEAISKDGYGDLYGIDAALSRARAMREGK